MNKLDKELEELISQASSYDWQNTDYDKILANIKTVILEALKAEWPEELELIEGREQFTSAFNGCRYDCLNVCNKLLGDSNAE